MHQFLEGNFFSCLDGVCFTKRHSIIHSCLLCNNSGLPIPIVAISAAVSHDQYGIDNK